MKLKIFSPLLFIAIIFGASPAKAVTVGWDVIFSLTSGVPTTAPVMSGMVYVEDPPAGGLVPTVMWMFDATGPFVPFGGAVSWDSPPFPAGLIGASFVAGALDGIISSGPPIVITGGFDTAEIVFTGDTATVITGSFAGAFTNIYSLDFRLKQPNSVSEPVTLALLGLGLVGVGFSKRRKSNV